MGQLSLTSSENNNWFKQVDILSPVLLSEYIDEFLLKLKEFKVEWHTGNLFSGTLGYANNLSLFCPSLSVGLMLVLLMIFKQFYQTCNALKHLQTVI